MKNLGKNLKHMYLAFVMAFVVALAAPAAVSLPGEAVAEAATKKPKLSQKKLTLVVGQSYKLKVKYTKAKATWSSTKKKVASISKKGVVKARKAGTATIKARVQGKTLKCKVVVVNAPAPASSASVSGNPTEFYQPNVDLNGASVHVVPYHIYFKDGYLYADSYVANNLSYAICNISVPNYEIYDANGTLVAKDAFGVIYNGNWLAAHSYIRWTFIFKPLTTSVNFSAQRSSAYTSYNY